MDHFILNGYLWNVRYVDPYNPLLIDRTGKRTVATTDPSTRCIYLSNTLSGDFLVRVVLHEVGHSALFSFGLLDDIHKMVKPEYWIIAEEWVCNLIADYGRYIYSSAFSVLGYDAIKIVPYELHRFIA